MSDQDKSLFDKVKDAFGMGGDQHDHGDEAHDHEGHDHEAHDHAAHDESADNPRIDKDNLGVDGATQGAASTGAGGGMGATAGLGGAGAGAGGLAGATPDPSKGATGPTDGTNVRTEYEMGHEFDSEHEKVAESGVLAEQADEAVVDTWRSGDEEPDPEK